MPFLLAPGVKGVGIIASERIGRPLNEGVMCARRRQSKYRFYIWRRLVTWPIRPLAMSREFHSSSLIVPAMAIAEKMVAK